MNKWIPANKDNLPSSEVLCCDRYGEMIIGYVHYDEGSNTWYSAESEHEYMYDCIAWQPLPGPYKGE